jgi:hypothetical protein
MPILPCLKNYLNNWSPVLIALAVVMTARDGIMTVGGGQG